MKEFILARGWYNAGVCNCTPKMDKYHHVDKPGWELRMNQIYYKVYFQGKQKTFSVHESFEKMYAKLFP